MTVAIDIWLLILQWDIDIWLLIFQWDKNQNPVNTEPIQSILASSTGVHPNVISVKNSKWCR